MQSPPSRSKRRRVGEATGQQTGAAAAHTMTELPSMHELMANHQNARRLLGRDMLVMRGDVPVQAVGTKVRVSQGRPQVWLDAMGGGMWMDATTALTNIVACGIVEKHPLLQNVHANTAMSRQDFNGDGIRLCGYWAVAVWQALRGVRAQRKGYSNAASRLPPVVWWLTCLVLALRGGSSTQRSLVALLPSASLSGEGSLFSLLASGCAATGQ